MNVDTASLFSIYGAWASAHRVLAWWPLAALVAYELVRWVLVRVVRAVRPEDGWLKAWVRGEQAVMRLAERFEERLISGSSTPNVEPEPQTVGFDDEPGCEVLPPLTADAVLAAPDDEIRERCRAIAAAEHERTEARRAAFWWRGLR